MKCMTCIKCSPIAELAKSIVFILTKQCPWLPPHPLPFEVWIWTCMNLGLHLSECQLSVNATQAIFASYIKLQGEQLSLSVVLQQDPCNSGWSYVMGSGVWRPILAL